MQRNNLIKFLQLSTPLNVVVIIIGLVLLISNEVEGIL